MVGWPSARLGTCLSRFATSKSFTPGCAHQNCHDESSEILISVHMCSPLCVKVKLFSCDTHCPAAFLEVALDECPAVQQLLGIFADVDCSPERCLLFSFVLANASKHLR